MCDLNSQNNQCNMDSACKVGWVTPLPPQCTPPPCTDSNYQYCPEYQYVDNSAPAHVVQPYFSIAQQYGFANYMFQTNQGPSFPAHQFIISGTSAPVAPGDPSHFDKDFAAENPAGGGLKYPGRDTGCPAPSGEYAAQINPSGSENFTWYNNGFPCYEHPTLLEELSVGFPVMPNDRKYYAPTPGSLWTGPNAIAHLCDPIVNGVCTGWASRAVFEGTPPNSLAPIFNDIANCQLAAVNWVIPDGRWSDHAGTVPSNGNLGLGPAYVAAIVNAIGNDKTCEQGSGYWSDTVVLIAWDDWGGWYDHVPPFKVVNDGISWGSGYVYGFRVPLLVVSGWTPQGYVSGALPPYGPGRLPLPSTILAAFCGSSKTISDWDGLFLPPTVMPTPTPQTGPIPSAISSRILLFARFSRFY
jgi:hypothetical protein